MSADYQECLPVTASSIQAFEDSMVLCFQEAERQGFKVLAITPHLDAASSSGESWSIRSWRNGVVFDPYTQHSGHSYQSIILSPLARALGRSIDLSKTRISFCLQGEMGATVFRYPGQYKRLLSSVRQTIIDASSSTSRVASQSSPGIKMGLSFNFRMVDGGQAPSNQASTQETISRAVFPGSSLTLGPILSSFLAPNVGVRSSSNAPPFDASSVIDLISALDFIGISAYAPLDLDFEQNDLQNSAFNFMAELTQALGTDADKLIRSRGIELHFVEFGVGGGRDAQGQNPTTDPSEAARKPWAGVFGPYTKSKDPWTRTPSVGNFMRAYYDKLLSWLESNTGPTYKIHNVYLWSLSSWDILAIYPESTTTDGSYLDVSVAQKVKLHNRNARSSW